MKRYGTYGLALFTGLMTVTGLAEDAYIESDGTQAIGLARKMTPRTRWEVDFAYTDVAAQQRVFGVSSGAGQLALYISGGNVFSFGASKPTAGGYPTTVAADTARHVAIGDGAAGRGYIVTGGVTNGTSAAFQVTDTSDYPLAVCAYAGNAEGTSFGLFAKARIYGVKVYEDGELVMDLVPASNASRIGLWDKVGEKFYGSSVGGTNFAGSEGLFDAEDAYLRADGTQYIDTGYRTTPTTRYELDYALEPINTAYNNGGTVQARLFAAAEDSSDVVSTVYVAGTAGGTDANVAFSSGDTWASVWSGRGFDAQRRTVVLDLANGKGRLLLNGALQVEKDVTRPTKTATRNLGLFGQLGADGRAGYYLARMKVYGFRIYEAGTLVHDYLPFVRNGIAGLRDEKDGVKFLLPVAAGRQFSYGGLIGTDGRNDAYLESSGDQIVNTSAVADLTSRIEVDFALAAHPGSQERVFGATLSKDLIYGLYCNGTTAGVGNFSIAAGDYAENSFPGYDTGVAVDLDRHTAILDFPARTVHFITGATTNYSHAITATKASTWLMGIFGEPYTANFSGTYNRSQVRLYSLKLYKSGTLVQHWLPFKDSTQLGLTNVVNGAFRGDGRASGVPFRIGGCGTRPSGEVFYDQPLASSVRRARPVTLSVYAPGAVGYQWYLAGEAIPEATNRICDVGWRQSRYPVPVFVKADFLMGDTIESRDSVTSLLTMQDAGFVVTFR